MNVQIVNVVETRRGAFEVTFASSCGTAIAQWGSKGLKPQVGTIYNVELDVSDAADRATNTEIKDSVLPALLFNEKTVLLRGKIEDVEEDGLAYLRMAADCLVMIETAGGISAGDAVQIRVPSSAVTITPTGI